MKPNPKISIVTPSYNQGEYIEETIRSVLEQDYEHVEYIVMDGGSTDQTVSIIERYADRIAYWVSVRDAGQSDAIERGFARATGDILAWVNSDDSLAPGALAAVAAAFGEDDPDMVAGIVNVRQDGRLVYHHRTGCGAGRLALEQLLDLDREWMTGRFFYQPEVFFTRDIYQRAGGVIDRSLHYSMDYDLWVRCARAGARIRPIDYELANFRMHAAQKTSSIAAFLPELKRHAAAFRGAVGLPPPVANEPTLTARRRLRVGMVNDYGFRYGAGRAHRRFASCLASSQYEVVAYAFLEAIGDNKTCRFETAVAAMRAAEVDVVILGNIHGVFAEGVDLAPLTEVAPVLVVTHDFFHLTGRCAYPLGCDQYLFLCPPTCPTREQYPVIPPKEIPIAHARKLTNLKLDDLHFLANSAYSERSVRQLFAIKQPGSACEERLHRVSLPVPETSFRPGDRAAARAAFNLDPSDVMVLTSSSDVMDRRKGFRHTLEACRLVSDPRVRLFALGWVASDQECKDVTYLGHVEDDEKLADCFRAADVFLSATADETFGQVFVEAALCGCPSIGYDVGGVRDALAPGRTGWLVERNNVAGLAERLRELVGRDNASREAMRRQTHIHAASRWGAAGFLAGINDVFRALVRSDEVVIPTGVQFGGIHDAPIRFMNDDELCHGVAFGPGFELLEGPYPEHGIEQKFRWTSLPEATFELKAPESGPVLLTITLANIHAAQRVELSQGGECIALFDLVAEPWSVSTDAAFALDLPAGSTTLRLTARQCLRTPDRDLYVAVLGITVEPTEVADGFRGVVRRQRDASASRSPAMREASSAPPPREMEPNLQLLSGFDTIEGPYPEAGVLTRLAWLTDGSGSISVASKLGDNVLGLDIHLPCRQDIVVGASGCRHVFAALGSTSWDHPTRLVVPLSGAPGWHEIEIECAHHFVDDAGRALRLAVLGVETTSGRLPDMTDRYGRPDTSLAVRTVNG